MAWETPKTDWTPESGVRAADLNRIEGNLQYLLDNPDGAKRPATVIVGTTAMGHLKGAVDYLCDGTADHEEISAAIASLPSSGGKIIILNGSYNLNASIVVNKPNVTIEGCGYNTIIGSSAATIVDITSARCTVNGLYLAGQNVTNQMGVNIATAATRCTVTNCVISDVDTGVKLSSTYANIYNNRFDYCNVYGVDMRGSYGSVKNNFFSECLISVRAYYISGVIITGNTIHASGAANGYGINAINTDTAAISNNIVRSAYVGIEVYSYPAGSTFCTVDNNLVIGCNNGIQLSNAHDNAISCNLVQNEAYTTTEYSLYVYGSNKNLINCNRLIGKTYTEVMSTGNGYTGNLTS